MIGKNTRKIEIPFLQDSILSPQSIGKPYYEKQNLQLPLREV
jgi:hypothetical protein